MTKKLAMIAAIEQIVAKQGVAVCKSSWGTTLGQGLYEFRVRHTAAEIRRLFGSKPGVRPRRRDGRAGAARCAASLRRRPEPAPEAAS
jgi:hypothetical protein